jgi:hypothetical protein
MNTFFISSGENAAMLQERITLIQTERHALYGNIKNKLI